MRARGVPDRTESVRGFACILLVLYHVVGSSSDAGMHLPQDHVLRSLMDCLAFVRMPIFTALSGYLFAANPPRPESLRIFTLKKFRRLGVPLLVATAVFGLSRYEIYGEPFALRSFFTSYLHLWFLQALLLLFVVFGIWHALATPSRVQLMLAMLFASLAMWSLPWFDGFSLGGALYLTPYFVFGILMRHHPALIEAAEWRILALGVLLLVMSTKALGTFGYVLDIPTSSLFAVICGCAAVLILMQRMPHVPILAAVGSFSYTIYLWHPIFGSAARQLLERLNAWPIGVFLASMGAALLMPILVHVAAMRLPYLSVALTGLRQPRPRAA
ncbi:peptidoglycan/LPS O-acetylase OafA/YrhL [Sphingomonas jejuensis]|uniref:Peptidoglycan/LPS O-acetylase OafA/YrhL n=1 Tax=Sphingomonas jejuensis TaxID=904715 RepID=A0ABX0XIC2_9SPHN|nr:acyltransferase [Sphingomonas jejuensis]NJC33087.1 peptidoglycan/LPS O-acetylase OafA/YrhL [Sphingomonas jejuensis]